MIYIKGSTSVLLIILKFIIISILILPALRFHSYPINCLTRFKMSPTKSTMLSILVATCSISRAIALPTASPQAPSCVPSSTFSLQAVSPDPTINDVYISIGASNAAFLNHTNPETTTFFKNDATHLSAYVLEEQGPTGEDGTAVELRREFAYNSGPVFSLVTDQAVFYGDYVASDVVFPKPQGKLGFEPEGNDGMLICSLTFVQSSLSVYSCLKTH